MAQNSDSEIKLLLDFIHSQKADLENITLEQFIDLIYTEKVNKISFI